MKTFSEQTITRHADGSIDYHAYIARGRLARSEQSFRISDALLRRLPNIAVNHIALAAAVAVTVAVVIV